MRNLLELILKERENTDDKDLKSLAMGEQFERKQQDRLLDNKKSMTRSK